MKNQLDWERLNKALGVEAETGFTDLMGNKYRFSEFLVLSFGEVFLSVPPAVRKPWEDIGERFTRYPQLNLAQRQNLVADTRRFLQELQYQIEEQKKPPETKLTVSRSQGKHSSVSLNQPLTKLKEVGSSRSPYLERLGLTTVRDLLFYYPRDYIDYARQVNIGDLVPGETVTLVGKVKYSHCGSTKNNKKLTILSLTIEDNSGTIKLSRFFAGTRFSNRGWQEKMRRQYPKGSVVAASGLVKKNKYGVTLDNPDIEVLDAQGRTNSLKVGRVLPVYSLTEGVAADLVRRAVLEAMGAVKQLQDPLQEELRHTYGLIGLGEAIANIHFPADPKILAQARRRLVFDEFFYLQLGFLQRRQEERKGKKSAIFVPKGKLIEQFNKLLPFTLTNAQQRVVNEILQDLRSEEPMNRLVQGDVGSGKTVVAVFAILAAIESGYQAALMAPTEVLAQQHYHKLVTWFNLLHLPVELLTSSTKTAKRRALYHQLTTGELPLLVGTHALIQDPVQFQRLGLVVIDEQHRFGVQQRGRLLAKGQSPHVLSLTATPIPRTLALTLHGDLDVSQIDELPPSRKPIQTTIVTGRQRNKAYELIRREIVQGRQSYIIFPLIEESEKLDLRAAVEQHERLRETIFPEFQVGLLHGRMTSAEKDEALSAFRKNETQIIVSTTVIEVGVDVPNATVMLIENAERFGLSQLHQLRGRVGRGSDKSYCLLMSGSKKPETIQRLGVLEQSQDGFFIAEMDLRFRGPGEVLGKRQSGLPDFALASLAEDQEVLVVAREAAEKLMLADPSLKGAKSIKKELEMRYERMVGGEVLT